MKEYSLHKKNIENNGFTIIEDFYSPGEVDRMIEVIDQSDQSNSSFRKSNDLFAIRKFLHEIPAIKQFIFNDRLRSWISELFGENYFPVKSIYFDKPGSSNWFVSYHQDLTISVDKKIELDGFGPWSIKPGQFSVQPPLYILENIYTIRIHFDDTNENNGALKVIPGSHRKGIYRPQLIDWSKEKEVSCNVKRGGIMIMKPLLLHSSGRTVNNDQRRVAHIELSDLELPSPLQWSEKIGVNAF